MDELECMRCADEAIRSLEDEAVRSRVVSWLAAKYLGSAPVAGGPLSAPFGTAPSGANVAGIHANQIAGIAKLSPSGEVQLTVRDFKAKSANDAAVRLVHVVIWATAKLKGEPAVSSKNVIVPLLRKYRCYDGNTRGAIANDKGLVRDGDTLSLDFHAEQHAEKLVKEILDESSEGKWKPGPTKRRVTRSTTDNPISGAA
jgi:hypothetical protein